MVSRKSHSGRKVQTGLQESKLGAGRVVRVVKIVQVKVQGSGSRTERIKNK